MDRTERLKRLHFRSSHRGCKESDILIGQFCDKYLNELNALEIDQLEGLLEEDDGQIWDWLTGKSEVPEAYAQIVKRLLGFSVEF